MSDPLEPTVWSLGPVDWDLVSDYSKRALRRASFEPDRRKQIHEGIALVLAGVCILHANGSFRDSAERWVRDAFAKIYGYLN